ncbi:MAG TPA: response regulator [Planctomycetota bacterium]|nr:response regulator [Planctomycetota bacterium]
MTTRLKVLVVEDSEDDAVLLLRELEAGGYDVIHRRVQTRGDMREALESDQWDLVMSDFCMPQFSALDALEVLRENGADIPFIIASGTIGEDTAVEALKAGAHDFMAKNRLARLLPAVARELREASRRRKQRQVELALQRAESKYRRIVETAREGIWELDSDGRTTYANSRIADMLGTTVEALQGTSLSSLVDEGWKKQAVELLARVGEGQDLQFQLKLLRRDGKEFWAALTASPVRDEAGAVTGTLAMLADVTESRGLQEQLMVSDRMASVGMLAAGVAHEINNPLMAVLANLESLIPSSTMISPAVSDDRLTQEERDSLRLALEAAERVRDIVRDLKVFSHPEEDQRRHVSIQRVLDSSLRMAYPAIRYRAQVVKDYQPVPLVDATDSRLGQVFLNLIINAAQSIDEGHPHSNEIRVCTRTDENGQAVVEIRDSGCGMSLDVVNRLFTPFFTTKPAGVGTGLGLSICNRIVTSLHGVIVVESEVGKGTTFRVCLPAANPRLATVAAPLPAPRSSHRRGRILVVDDEIVLGNALRRMLAPEHEVTVVTSAEQALVLVKTSGNFDVILCDVMMPVMTGIDLHTQLTLLGSDYAERVIFMTGGAFTRAASDFLAVVPNDRLDKPFASDLLRATVNRRLQ